MILAVLPILLFLGGLLLLDSYKLVRLPAVLLAIAAGGLAAGATWWAGPPLLALFGGDLTLYTRYGAPVVEEAAKAAPLVLLMAAGRIGFMVDAAIYGFALGTGFAVVENAIYINALPDATPFVWVVRGFGTATMHGGATAICGIIAKTLEGRRGEAAAAAPAAPDAAAANPAPARARGGAAALAADFLPGLAAAVALHSVFNHFFFSPAVSTLVILLVFPALISLVFVRSERALRRWLGAGFDADTALLELIESGEFPDSPMGRYLQALRARFPGPVVADMLCYIRLHVELWIRAKGLLMLRGMGLPAPEDPEIAAKFKEIDFLVRSIGRTGRLALAPVLQARSRDLWQIYMLDRKY